MLLNCWWFVHSYNKVLHLTDLQWCFQNRNLQGQLGGKCRVFRGVWNCKVWDGMYSRCWWWRSWEWPETWLQIWRQCHSVPCLRNTDPWIWGLDSEKVLFWWSQDLRAPIAANWRLFALHWNFRWFTSIVSREATKSWESHEHCTVDAALHDPALWHHTNSLFSDLRPYWSSANTTGSLFQNYVYNSFSMKMVLNCIYISSVDLVLVKDKVPGRKLIKMAALWFGCVPKCSCLGLLTCKYNGVMCEVQIMQVPWNYFLSQAYSGVCIGDAWSFFWSALHAVDYLLSLHTIPPQLVQTPSIGIVSEFPYLSIISHGPMRFWFVWYNSGLSICG